MSRYVIAGGRQGKDRLKLISEALLPTTTDLFSKIGLREGMNCLDMGCGGGHVTLLLGRLVGPEGKVVGVDLDKEIIELAREDAKSEGLHQVEFRHSEASACKDGCGYDLVYARFLLTHLTNPEQCIATMLDMCSPGGTIAVEDIDFNGNFCYPPCEAYQKYTGLYQTVVDKRGGDANIGPRLPLMLRNAGLADIRLNVVQPTYLSGDGKYLAAVTMARIADSVISEGLATKGEIDDVVAGLNGAAADTNTVMGLPRIFQVWGRRAQ